MKQAEMERVRILSKLKQLSQLSSDGEVIHSDMSVNLTKKTRTFADLQEEFIEVTDRITHLEIEVDNLRALNIAN